MKRISLSLGIAAGLAICSPFSAMSQTTIPTLVCIPHGDLVKKLAARGQTFVMDGKEFLPDGRKVEVFGNLTTGLWTIVATERVGGRVTTKSCSKVFGEGDPGVVPPP